MWRNCLYLKFGVLCGFIKQPEDAVEVLVYKLGSKKGLEVPFSVELGRHNEYVTVF